MVFKKIRVYQLSYKKTFSKYSIPVYKWSCEEIFFKKIFHYINGGNKENVFNSWLSQFITGVIKKSFLKKYSSQ